MYLSMRAAFVRNVATTCVNGLITLVLLLIAPLGLAAVISTTVFVSLATFLVGTGFDLMIGWLSRGRSANSLSGGYARGRTSFDSPLSSEIQRIRQKDSE